MERSTSHHLGEEVIERGAERAGQPVEGAEFGVATALDRPDLRLRNSRLAREFTKAPPAVVAEAPHRSTDPLPE